MTAPTREMLAHHVALVLGAHPGWRYGQTVFNVAYDLMPAQANKLRGSMLDPFYNDDRADAFLDALFAARDGVA